MRKNTYLGLALSGLALAALGGLAPACDGSAPTAGIGCPNGGRYIGGQCLQAYGVKLNSIGFLPARQKKATFGGTDPAFSVRAAESGDVVLSGTAVGPTRNADTDERLFIADFSSLETEGEYYVEAAGDRSATFTVGRSALDGLLHTLMLGMTGQRCGQTVSFEYGNEYYSHVACHTDPASLSRLGGGIKDDTGGWHDAGDYGKYTLPGGFSVGLLLQAFEHFEGLLAGREFDLPERGGDVPDILDEARVELEWLLKVQFDDGSFSHKVTGANFEGEVMPEGDGQARFFISAGTPATGSATAALALAARLYAPYDADFAATCLDAALRGQAFLEANPGLIEPDQSGILTGSYGDRNDSDERFWALTELWETTGEAEYLESLEERIETLGVRSTFGWPDSANLGFSTYVFSEREGRNSDLLNEVRWDLQAAGRGLTSASRAHGYGRGFDAYYWGTNGTVALMSHTLFAEHKVAADTQALDALVAQIDFLLGRNFDGRSYVTSIGVDGPKHPHHRPSTNDAALAPWPGLLVGGPGPEGNTDTEALPATTYVDTQANYYDNEVTIYWNAALIYAVAAAIATQDDRQSAECQPDCVAPPTTQPGGMGGAGGAAP